MASQEVQPLPDIRGTCSDTQVHMIVYSRQPTDHFLGTVWLLDMMARTVTIPLLETSRHSR